MSEEIVSSDNTLDTTEIIDILNPKDHSFVNSFTGTKRMLDAIQELWIVD